MDAEEDDALVLQIVDEEDDSYVDSISEKLETLAGTPMEATQCTIFRVPAYIRRSYGNLYEPLVVSIGPYHRGKDALRAMEEHKWRYLRDFLSRAPVDILRPCLRRLRALEPRARRCYFESVGLGVAELVETLLLDGCFVLEFLMKRLNGENDTVMEVTWNWHLIKNDLLMLENQIPFFVLQSLFDVLMANSNRATSPGVHVKVLVHYLLSEELSSTAADMRTAVPLTSDKIHHLLHLYHQYFVPPPDTSEQRSRCLAGLLRCFKLKEASAAALTAATTTTFYRYITSAIRRGGPITATTAQLIRKSSPGSIPCATKLLEAGVRLRRKESARSFLDVTFKNGVLEVPFVSIDETTKSRFANLVALEQCGMVAVQRMTSYAWLMDCMVDTPMDVEVLRRSRIVDNMLACNEEAALFFNQLAHCAYMNSQEHYLTELFRDVNAYCSSDWHEWRAKLVRDYFGSPWALASVAAAVMLLVLTLLQTFFAMYSYFHPPS